MARLMLVWGGGVEGAAHSRPSLRSCWSTGKRTILVRLADAWVGVGLGLGSGSGWRFDEWFWLGSGSGLRLGRLPFSRWHLLDQLLRGKHKFLCFGVA